MWRRLLRGIFKQSFSLGWRYRHLADKGWAKKYASAEALSHPHRETLVGHLSYFWPVYSVLELGCGAGANLVRIAKTLPIVFVAGIDISPVAIKESAKLLEAFRVGFMTLQGDASNPEALSSLACDVILTDAFLIYVSPKKLLPLITVMKEVCRSGLLLCEWDGEERKTSGGWIHDFRKYLPGAIYYPISPLEWDDEQWTTNGKVIVWHKQNPVMN